MGGPPLSGFVEPPRAYDNPMLAFYRQKSRLWEDFPVDVEEPRFAVTNVAST
ncbi:hypothetical protein M407DRAFT_25196 [Tulasnella calospora MUT 4182]|uniref:Uncharacterized protein n=1 Tax=Tulasnella calospora MUT 4182 TaxID=1051891 RepID=A0A0C3QI00_9AGAM|nr:hypothetical protein M407DRAFT_25196 [Tulasnella calospora MUT 4182]